MRGTNFKVQLLQIRVLFVVVLPLFVGLFPSSSSLTFATAAEIQVLQPTTTTTTNASSESTISSNSSSINDNLNPAVNQQQQLHDEENDTDPTKNENAAAEPQQLPNLSGQHFKITVLGAERYVDIDRDPQTGKATAYSGYIIDILQEISKENRANFTYELVTPSGYGSKCNGGPNSKRLNYSSVDATEHDKAYSSAYQFNYRCGESDVMDLPHSNFTTDMYWGVFYITPERLRYSQMTTPISPPGEDSLSLFGPLTNVDGLKDVLENHYEIPICGYIGTAYTKFIKAIYPQLNLQEIPFSTNATYQAFDDGLCQAAIVNRETGKKFIRDLHKSDRCTVQDDDKPIGFIGKGIGFGLKDYGFGIRKDIDPNVVRTINFWLHALMTCFPQDPTGFCYSGNGGGSLYELFGKYRDLDTKGDECGYVQYPTNDTTGPSPGVIAAMVITPVIFVVVIATLCHLYRMKVAEERTKKRFVQQIARNIDISSNVRGIPAEKLAELFAHIGGADGLISKSDLAKWMNDLHMEFLTETEFNTLWQCMDIEDTGTVDPIDFISFLKECAPQFEEVHKEYSSLPKSERLKLASRRLSTLKMLGEEEVLRMERRNNKRSRDLVLDESTMSKLNQVDRISETTNTSTGMSSKRLSGSGSSKWLSVRSLLSNNSGRNSFQN